MGKKMFSEEDEEEVMQYSLDAYITSDLELEDLPVFIVIEPEQGLM